MKASERQQLYLRLASLQQPRLLGLLDRHPFSPTYGCFDRRFWLHRTSDFPSTANQMGMESLAWLLREPANQANKRSQEALRNWILAAIDFTLRSQNRDGSFDEWYPGEHGWAGPTGYIISSLSRTIDLCGDVLSPEIDHRIKICFERAGSFLSRYEERDVLANHQVMALAALAAIDRKLGRSDFSTSRDEIWKRFEHSLSSEGWSLEYDGPDPGYQTATLSFLARLHRLTGEERIEKIIPSQLEFLSHFFFPDSSFSGPVGSRGTRNLFVFGFEYWAAKYSLAARLAAAAAESLERGHCPRPEDQEDHYLIYRLPEFFEAADAAKNDSQQRLPYEGGDFEKSFGQAGIVIKKKSKNYLVANLKRGGSYALFSGKDCLAVDAGVVLKTSQGYFTSNWSRPNPHQSARNDYVSEGPLHAMKFHYFNPLKLVIFRLLLFFFSSSPRLAWAFKAWIRRRLMVGARPSRIHHVRSFSFSNEQFTVTDHIQIPKGITLHAVWCGGEFLSRLVPQSRYFAPSDMAFTPEFINQTSEGSLHHTKAFPWGEECVE